MTQKEIDIEEEEISLLTFEILVFCVPVPSECWEIRAQPTKVGVPHSDSAALTTEPAAWSQTPYDKPALDLYCTSIVFPQAFLPEFY